MKLIDSLFLLYAIASFMSVLMLRCWVIFTEFLMLFLFNHFRSALFHSIIWFPMLTFNNMRFYWLVIWSLALWTWEFLRNFTFIAITINICCCIKWFLLIESFYVRLIGNLTLIILLLLLHLLLFQWEKFLLSCIFLSHDILLSFT
jgi:hypothetical protein